MNEMTVKLMPSARLWRGQARPGAQPDQVRLQDPGDGRLAHPAQRQRGQGDAQLAHREIGVEAAEDAVEQAGPGAALVDQLLHAGGPQLDDGELGGDEEGVGQHQDRGQEERGARGEHGREFTRTAASGSGHGGDPGSAASYRCRVSHPRSFLRACDGRAVTTHPQNGRSG
jgi:hypothetical protein